jgi:hypothetical protein
MASAQETAPEPTETASINDSEAEESTEETNGSEGSRTKQPLGPLFDRFSFKISGRFAELDTTVRGDDKTRDRPGTEIDFETDLGLGSSEFLNEFRFQLLLGRRHRVGLRYDRNDRSGLRTIATEIRFEDVVFPINAELESSFNSRNIGASYTYFFIRKERTALGGTLALILGDYEVALTGIGQEDLEDVELTAEAGTSVPQPQIGLEFRQMIGEKWRFLAAGGGLALNLEDGSGGRFDGSVYNLTAEIEHLSFKYWSFGAGLGANHIDATFEDDDDRLQVDTTTAGGEIFIRFRTP